jgi:hypothetical protein
MSAKLVRPDSKGRISLGHYIAEGVSAYSITESKDHKLILEPYVEMPAREKWLFNNKTALTKVKRGLKDAAEGRLIDKGNFSQYVDDDID